MQNLMKIYAVRVGSTPGIYSSWTECSKQVIGFSGAEYKSFPTKEEALRYLGVGFIDKPSSHAVGSQSDRTDVRRVDQINANFRGLPSLASQPVKTPSISPASSWTSSQISCPTSSQISCPTSSQISCPTSEKISQPIYKPTCNERTIYVDGGHNRQTGDEAWGCVVDSQGCDLLPQFFSILTDMEMKDVVLPVGRRRVLVSKFDDVVSQQNNGAELLALVAGIRIALTQMSSSNGSTEGSSSTAASGSVVPAAMSLSTPSSSMSASAPSVSSQGITICSDSDLMVSHWSRKLSSMKERTMDPRKVAWIRHLIELRSHFEAIGGRIAKIPGKGNPADLGYH